MSVSKAKVYNEECTPHIAEPPMYTNLHCCILQLNHQLNKNMSFWMKTDDKATACIVERNSVNLPPGETSRKDLSIYLVMDCEGFICKLMLPSRRG